MKGAVQKKITSLATDIRGQLRDKNIRHQGIDRSTDSISINFGSNDEAEAARTLLNTVQPDLTWIIKSSGGGAKLSGEFKPKALKEIQDNAVKQNITTLNKRVNELAVKEPVIQQQGAERIVVQLPGVQDTARAKDIIGRTATLEARLADPLISTIAVGETPPPGTDAFRFGENRLGVFKKSVIFSGDRITDASAGFDQNQRPAVNISLDAAGGRVMQEVTRENIGKPMGMILFEKGKGEVLTIATIQSEFGSKFQITGQPTTESANDLALLLRAGSLAAPMEIIEERAIGPSLGAENIEKGFKSLLIGFAAISIFMIAYYLLFGTFSVVALAVNLLLLISVLSMLQATLTLPGIAAMALALGMAIDSNVLINERIREELRNGSSPQTAIAVGFDKAWATILDSNVTTLIAGLALLAFGSGPIKGFAVVHCLGILTSMFSAVFFSRGLVNLWYGRHKKIQKLAIGQVWRPQEK
jgi:preprotein translocase subunit SecD